MTLVGERTPRRRQLPSPAIAPSARRPRRRVRQRVDLPPPEMIAGDLLASAPSSSPPRDSKVAQVSINNLSRLEVSPSPNTNSPASAPRRLGQSCEQNAFERANPSAALPSYGSFRENDVDHLSVKKSAGPYRDSNFKRSGHLDFQRHRAGEPPSNKFPSARTLRSNRFFVRCPRPLWLTVLSSHFHEHPRISGQGSL